MLNNILIKIEKWIFSLVFPWLKKELTQNWGRIKQEINQSEEMLHILWRFAQREKITIEEKQLARQQLLNIIRLVPALAIFMLPGGLLLLPILAKALPWDLLPTSFRRPQKPAVNASSPSHLQD